MAVKRMEGDMDGDRGRHALQAFSAASALRRSELAVVASRPRPCLVDGLDGFVVECESEGAGRRYVRVVLDEGRATLSTHDTAAGSDDPDASRTREEDHASWKGIAAYLAEEGVGIEAVVDGREAVIEPGRNCLILHEAGADGEPGRRRAHVRFDPGRVSCQFRAAQGTGVETFRSQDWHHVEAFLAERGVTLRAVEAEPAPTFVF